MATDTDKKRERSSPYERLPKNINMGKTSLKYGYFHILNANNGRGKTTYLSSIAKYILRNLNLADLHNTSYQYSNLICLSGTAFDRFDKYTTFKKYLSGKKRINTFYYYTGYTSNGNMSTPQIPFRILFEVLSNYLHKNPTYDLKSREEFLSKKLSDLGFKDFFTIKLQSNQKTQGKKTTDCEKIIGLKKYNNDIDYINYINDIKKVLNKKEEDILDIYDIKKVLYIIKHGEKNGEEEDKKGLELQDIVFYKENGSKYSIYDLSSGEYSFIRALFVFSLATQERSFIIFDEPENSLHPEWQTKLIKYIIESIKKFGKGKATVIVATHSPLITASFSIKEVKISDYPENQGNPFHFEWVDYKYFGWNSNLILKKQFDLVSPRPEEFIEQFNKILKSYRECEWDELDSQISHLENDFPFELPEYDGLFETYELIKQKLQLYKSKKSS